MDYYIQTNTEDRAIGGAHPWDIVCSHCGETMDTVWLTNPLLMNSTPWVQEVITEHYATHCTDGITD